MTGYVTASKEDKHAFSRACACVGFPRSPDAYTRPSYDVFLRFFRFRKLYGW